MGASGWVVTLDGCMYGWVGPGSVSVVSTP